MESALNSAYVAMKDVAISLHVHYHTVRKACIAYRSRIENGGDASIIIPGELECKWDNGIGRGVLYYVVASSIPQFRDYLSMKKNTRGRHAGSADSNPRQRQKTTSVARFYAMLATTSIKGLPVHEQQTIIGIVKKYLD